MLETSIQDVRQLFILKVDDSVKWTDLFQANENACTNVESQLPCQSFNQTFNSYIFKAGLQYVENPHHTYKINKAA